MALIGYARVSTTEQNLDLQRNALAKAGCEEIREDQASGVKAERPGLAGVLGHVRRGDTLVVWKLDRLGRSMAHLIETVRKLDAKGVGFRSLTEEVDTTTLGGMPVFSIFGALAQFECDLICKRTSAWLRGAGAAAARAGGGQW
jgi:DNA invertase Pin-like site-specific DNA recombinase